MKKLIRIFIWSLVLVGILCVGADYTLRRLSRRPEFKHYVLTRVQDALQRDVRAEKITASLYGIELMDAAVSEEGGFENGTFFTVPRARIYFSFSHLLHFHLKIKGVGLQGAEIFLIKQPDGTFNFESIGGNAPQPEEQAADEDGNPFLGLMSIGSADLRNVAVVYEDRQTHQTLRVENLNLTVYHFAFDEEFTFDLNTAVSYDTPSQDYALNVAMRARVYLNDLDFSQAYAVVENATLKQQNTLLQLSGRVENWDSPVFDVKATCQKLQSGLVRPFVKDFPLFEIPQVLLVAQGQTDVEKQHLTLSSFTLAFNGGSLNGAGNVNYQTGAYQSDGKFLLNFAALLTWLPEEWQPFILKQGTLSGTARAETDGVSGTVDLQVPAGTLQARGWYKYPQDVYDVDADFKFDFDEMAAYFPKAWKKFGIKGDVDGLVDVDGKQVVADLHILEGGFFHPVMGHFSNVFATFTAQESMDFSSGSAALKWVGDLNQGPMTADVSLTHTPQVIKGIVNAYSKRVALPPAPPSRPTEEEEDFVLDTQLAPVGNTAWSLPPIELQTDIKIDSLDAPYLYATDVSFTSDLQGITPKLDQAHGVLKLSMGKGTILDLYKLTNANPLTKVLFLSLNVVGKVFNTLNVFGVLNGIGKGMISAVTGGKKKQETETRMVVQPMLDENGKPIEMLVPYTDKKVKGQQDYEKFETEIKFDNGLASIRKGTFVSNMMSMRLDGTTDFNNGEIDLKVHAAPGKHEVNGVMPLTVNIGGTVADPKASMSVMGSVASLVTQGVTKNVVSRNVHKGIKSFFRLFKKKDNSNETEEMEDDDETAEESAEAEMPENETAPEAETISEPAI